jgi:phosphoglycolate phosphatase
VLFDLDGTLLDSLPGIQFSVDAAFSTCRQERRDVPLRSLIGPPIRTILSRLCEFGDERVLDSLEKSFRASYDTEGWQRTELFPGVLEALGTLRASRVRLFVVSNKPRHISTEILRSTSALHLFDSILTRDSRSPSYSGKAEMMSCLLDIHQIKPDSCLMVGDTIEDAEAAAYNGIAFCLMTHGYGGKVSESKVSKKLRFKSFAAFMSKTGKEKKND